MRIIAVVSVFLLVAAPLAAIFELDRHVARLVRIWRAERRRKARRGYVR